MKPHSNSTRSGFTLIEVLAVIAIIAVIITALTVNIIPSLAKGRDGRRKADLHKIATALEEYYNDKGTYPSELHPTNGTVSVCGQNTVLSNSLKEVPCDVRTKLPYLYLPQCASGVCKTYRLYAVLDNKHDPDIEKLGCSEENGCYKSGVVTYTYGVAVGIQLDANGD